MRVLVQVHEYVCTVHAASEAGLRHSLKLLHTLLFGTGSLIEPGARRFSSTDCLVGSGTLLFSAPTPPCPGSIPPRSLGLPSKHLLIESSLQLPLFLYKVFFYSPG